MTSSDYQIESNTESDYSITGGRSAVPVSVDVVRDARSSGPEGPRRRVWPWTRLVLWLIRGYQHAMEGRPSPCRFTPSCSTYAVESLETHGLLRGSRLAVWRILRCNPWGGQGFDPVPDPRSTRSRWLSPACIHHKHNHQRAH